MTAKLTLRLDSRVISKAKKTARRRGVSVSRMVEDYFKSVARQQESPSEESPVLSEISGVLTNKKTADGLLAGYRKHLVEKYR